MAFKHGVITEKGREMMAHSLATGKDIEFLNVYLGDGKISGIESCRSETEINEILEKCTTCQSQKAVAEVVSVARKDDVCTVTATTDSVKKLFLAEEAAVEASADGFGSGSIIFAYFIAYDFLSGVEVSYAAPVTTPENYPFSVALGIRCTSAREIAPVSVLNNLDIALTQADGVSTISVSDSRGVRSISIRDDSYIRAILSKSLLPGIQAEVHPKIASGSFIWIYNSYQKDGYWFFEVAELNNGRTFRRTKEPGVAFRDLTVGNTFMYTDGTNVEFIHEHGYSFAMYRVRSGGSGYTLHAIRLDTEPYTGNWNFAIRQCPIALPSEMAVLQNGTLVARGNQFNKFCCLTTGNKVFEITNKAYTVFFSKKHSILLKVTYLENVEAKYNHVNYFQKLLDVNEDGLAIYGAGWRIPECTVSMPYVVDDMIYFNSDDSVATNAYTNVTFSVGATGAGGVVFEQLPENRYKASHGSDVVITSAYQDGCVYFYVSTNRGVSFVKHAVKVGSQISDSSATYPVIEAERTPDGYIVFLWGSEGHGQLFAFDGTNDIVQCDIAATSMNDATGKAVISDIYLFKWINGHLLALIYGYNYLFCVYKNGLRFEVVDLRFPEITFSHIDVQYMLYIHGIYIIYDVNNHKGFCYSRDLENWTPVYLGESKGDLHFYEEDGMLKYYTEQGYISGEPDVLVL